MTTRRLCSCGFPQISLPGIGPDRERVGSALVDTPTHLDALTESIRAHGVRVPLRLGFNASYGFLDGNHRLAAALRLGLAEVPVELVREVPALRRDHGRPMRPDDLVALMAADDPPAA